jgi:ERCC4-related helicase
MLAEKGVKYRLLALSATPGGDTNKIQEVVRNLSISRIEFRSEEDADVAQYTHQRDVQVGTGRPTVTVCVTVRVTVHIAH